MASDFIDAFMAYTEGIPSPANFRLWAAIAAVGGALERRVCAITAGGTLYPNLFTLLVAAPAIGKGQAIQPVLDLWYESQSFKIMPDDVTKASFIDALAKASVKRNVNGNLLEYHSLLAPAPEFGVLVPAHDTTFLNVLNYIFDCPRVYREDRRSLEKKTEIIHPQVNILAGTQPGYLSATFPDEAWSMGFCSRLIMVYGATTPEIDIFALRGSKQPEFDALKATLSRYSELIGVVQWNFDAQNMIKAWYGKKMAPVPEHSKLVHYNGRRLLHFLKLCIISAVSRTQELVITLEDAQRARDWLLEVEITMPDIFREMVKKSDSDILQELHIFAWRIFSQGKSQPLHVARLVNFVKSRVPAEKVMRIIEIAERSGALHRCAGTMDMYIPAAKTDILIE